MCNLIYNNDRKKSFFFYIYFLYTCTRTDRKHFAYVIGKLLCRQPTRIKPMSFYINLIT